MEPVQAILRGLQILWLILLTALIGNVIASNISTATSAKAALNFSMFVIVLSWLAALFGTVVALTDRFSIPIVILAADGAAIVFTFVDAIVLAAKLGVVNCAQTANKGVGWIAYGSLNDENRCREVQASTVFMWFLFATFLASLGMFLRNVRRGGGNVRSNVPTMSQGTNGDTDFARNEMNG